MKNFAVLSSGRGTNLQAIIKAHKIGSIKGNLVLVISDKPDAYALIRAKKAGIKALFIDPAQFSGRESFDREVVRELKAHKIDLVVLAGYMRILSKHFIDAFNNRILNVHPSLLPSFKGAHAVRDALRYGVKVTGVTIHLVIFELDSGPIVLQESLEVKDSDTEDTLLERIHKIEHKLYPKGISLFLENRLKIKNNKVCFKK